MVPLEEIKQRFEEEGIGIRVSIEPSGIQGSPYNHVFVFLTEEENEGPHYIVSDNRELEDRDGIIVGYYQHYEAPGTTEVVDTLDQVIRLCRPV